MGIGWWCVECFLLTTQSKTQHVKTCSAKKLRADQQLDNMDKGFVDATDHFMCMACPYATQDLNLANIEQHLTHHYPAAQALVGCFAYYNPAPAY